MSNVEKVDEIISLENLGFGNILRNAREKKGLSLADIGAELRLDEAIVYAIENHHLDKLPEPAYVCGYIRNYARLMELNIENIVNSYKKDVSLKSNLVSVNSISQVIEKKQEKRTLLFLFFLVLLLMIGSFIGWKIWKNNQSTQLTVDRSKPQHSIMSLNSKQQIKNEVSENNSTEKNLEKTIIAPINQDIKLALQQKSFTPEGVSSDENSIKTENITKLKDNQEASLTEINLNPQIVTAISVEDKIKKEDKFVVKKQLEFIFSKNSWISVKDGKNISLIYDLIRKGEHMNLSGYAPVDVFLGDGTGVELIVDGENFDFSEHINKKNIAKFMVK